MSARILHTGQRGQPRTLKKSADLRLLTDIPPAPAYFDADRQAIWREYAGHLVARGDLAEADLGTLENYVMALADYRVFSQQLAQHGHLHTNVQGNLVQHPTVALRRNAEMQMAVCAGLLGLSPRGRAGMKREMPADDSPAEETKKAGAF